jgi:diguanylate cyclase (GGDEF)-like protein
MKKPLLRALQGAVLASGAPLGWMLLQWVGGFDPLEDLRDAPGVYLYMLIATIIAFAGFGAYVGRNEQLYRDRALHDPLTGLYNLRHFRQQLSRQLVFAIRQKTPLSLIILDLDHFKRVNDRYGHAVGDEVLVGVARALEEHQRSGDIPARIGGEEFALLLPFADEPAAAAAAERLRQAIADVEFSVPGDTAFRVTASFGVACRLPGDGESSVDLLEKADRAMYAAKTRGRNRVVSARSL